MSLLHRAFAHADVMVLVCCILCTAIGCVVTQNLPDAFVCMIGALFVSCVSFALILSRRMWGNLRKEIPTARRAVNINEV